MNTQKAQGLAAARADISLLPYRTEGSEVRYLRPVPRVDSIFEDHDEEIFDNPQASVEQIVRAVLDHLIASGVFPQLSSPTQIAAPIRQKKPRVTPADLGLTKRETDVLRILAQGKSNKEICRTLNIALGTGKIHTRSVCAKLKVSGRAEAIAAVNRMGMVL